MSLENTAVTETEIRIASCQTDVLKAKKPYGSKN